MQPKVKGFGKDRREMSAEVKTKEMGAMKIQLYKCKDLMMSKVGKLGGGDTQTLVVMRSWSSKFNHLLRQEELEAKAGYLVSN